MTDQPNNPLHGVTLEMGIFRGKFQNELFSK